MKKILVCPCNKCVTYHPVYTPAWAPKTVSNHCRLFGVDPTRLPPTAVPHIVPDPDEAAEQNVEGGVEHEPWDDGEQDESDRRDGDDHNSECSDTFLERESDEAATTDSDSEPLERPVGRPQARTKICNRVALEVVLDKIRKHNLTDACANDSLLIAQMETQLFSEPVKTVNRAEQILCRKFKHVGAVCRASVSFVVCFGSSAKITPLHK